MKTLMITLIASLAILAAAAPQALAEAPWSTDLELNSTNATADFELAEAVQPTALRLYGVLPLSATPQTVTVTRVHGDYTEAITSFVLASNVAAASTNLTSAPWILLSDKVRITGPTNAVLEFQGNR